jgi:hypothetical protein
MLPAPPSKAVSNTNKNNKYWQYTISIENPVSSLNICEVYQLNNIY